MRRILLGLMLASLVCSAPAAAKSAAVVPPGNGGIDQYFETVPGIGGGVGTQHHKPGHDPAVNTHTRQVLSHLGANGRGAALAADATAQGSASSRSSSSGSGGQPSTPGAGSSQAPSGHGGTATPGSPAPASGSSTSTSHPSSGKTSQPASSGGSPFTALVNAVTSGTNSEGMGAVQPIILMLVLLGAAAYVWHRRKRDA